MDKQKYVLGFIFNKDKTKIALIRKDRPEWQKGLLNAVGGKVEADETSFEAMIRECKEETDQLILINEWRNFCNFSGDWGSVECFFTVFQNLNLLHCYESENIEIHLVSELKKEKTSPDLELLISKAIDN